MRASTDPLGSAAGHAAVLAAAAQQGAACAAPGIGLPALQPVGLDSKAWFHDNHAGSSSLHFNHQSDGLAGPHSQAAPQQPMGAPGVPQPLAAVANVYQDDILNLPFQAAAAYASGSIPLLVPQHVMPPAQPAGRAGLPAAPVRPIPLRSIPVQPAAAPSLGPVIVGLGALPQHCNQQQLPGLSAAEPATPKPATAAAATATARPAPPPTSGGAAANSHTGQAARLPPTAPEATVEAASDPAKRQKTGGKQKAATLVGGRDSTIVLNTTNSRSAAQVAPHNFPIGPIPGTDKDLVDVVKSYTTNTNVAGGGWGVRKCGRVSATSAHFDVVRMGCSCARTEDCKWEVAYESTKEGWVLYRYHAHRDKTWDAVAYKVRETTTQNHHSHELLQTPAEVMADVTGRYFPPWAGIIGETMMPVNQPSVILRTLNNEANRRGEHITWNLGDIKSRFPMPAATRDWDCNGLIDFLRTRRDTQNLSYEVKVNDGNQIVGVYVEFEDAIAEYAEAGSENVILFDPTHGTNVYKMKLCCTTTVGPTGRTVILSACLISYEDYESVLWAFQCFHRTFRVRPAAIFTDEGASISKAFKEFSAEGMPWHGVLHKLCIFHLSKLFYQHVKPVLSDDSDIFHKAVGYFWTISKGSDAVQKETFDDAWNELVDYVKKNSKSSDEKISDCVDWLEGLREKKHMFVYCFAWETVSLGINSTQRQESAHKVIKQKMWSANLNMQSLITLLEQLNRTSRDYAEIDDVRKTMRLIGSSDARPSYLNALIDRVTPYALDMLYAQWAQASKYKALPQDTSHDANGNQVYTVTCSDRKEIRIPSFDDDGYLNSHESPEDVGLIEDYRVASRSCTTTWCSCQRPSSLRIPCAHQCAVILRTQHETDNNELTSILMELIGPKWLLRKETEKSKLLTRLLSQERSSYEKPACAAPGSQQRLSRQDRRQLLMSQLFVLADIGEVSTVMMKTVLRGVKNLVNDLNDPVEHHVPSTPSSSQRRAQNEGSTDISTAAPETTDYASFKACLGTTYTPDADQPHEDAATACAPALKMYEGRPIAHKWSDRTRGGWALGKILKCYVEPDAEREDGAVECKVRGKMYPLNARVSYPADNSVYDVALDFGLLCQDVKDNQPKLVWLLLKEKDTSNAEVEAMADNGTLRQPPNFPKQGRPQTVRLRPKSGPTS